VLFLGFVPCILNMQRRALMEESHLASKLGSDYRVFLESVPRSILSNIAKRELPRR